MIESAVLTINFKDLPETVIGYRADNITERLLSGRPIQLFSGIHTPAEWGVSPPLANVFLSKLIHDFDHKKLAIEIKKYAKLKGLPYYIPEMKEECLCLW